MTEPASSPRQPPANPTQDDIWHSILTGTGPRRQKLQQIFRHLPSEPRCRMCSAPFGRPFGPIVHALGFGRFKNNPQLCNPCFTQMSANAGGSEVEVSILFADVRGSTAIAEQMAPAAYSRLLDGFYRHVSQAVIDQGGIIDKYLGDGVMALFIPGFESDHAGAAVRAARTMLAQAELPIGIGVHTGQAYVGFMGDTKAVMGFSALGDAVNAAHRLGELAPAAELLISEAAATAAHLDTTGLERRELSLKGREQGITAWAERIEATTPTGERTAGAA